MKKTVLSGVLPAFFLRSPAFPFARMFEMKKEER